MSKTNTSNVAKRHHRVMEEQYVTNISGEDSEKHVTKLQEAWVNDLVLRLHHQQGLLVKNQKGAHALPQEHLRYEVDRVAGCFFRELGLDARFVADPANANWRVKRDSDGSCCYVSHLYRTDDRWNNPSPEADEILVEFFLQYRDNITVVGSHISRINAIHSETLEFVNGKCINEDILLQSDFGAGSTQDSKTKGTQNAE